jgi:acyl-CoA synthetase (AMP-forming)/AMP-acid ligase II
LEFISAFFGCIYAGMLAVPAYQPQLSKDKTRLAAIASDSGARVALGTKASLARIAQSSDEDRLGAVHEVLATDNDAPLDLARFWTPVTVSDTTVAYLQYTSGSTSAPRGVMISHGNVLHNLMSLKKDFIADEHSVFVSWLPHFHDMGLVFGLLLPLYCGVPSYLMSPMAFVQRPLRWLQAISTYRATHTAGPNLAYDLCLRRISPDQQAQLDLSSWRVALNGAEPVRQDTLTRFSKLFAHCGFRETAFYPGYGLAEATLEVSGGRDSALFGRCSLNIQLLEEGRIVDADDEKSRLFVACGTSAPATTIAIVDPETRIACLADTVGEIWVSSPSVAQGYWNRPEETAYTFHGNIVGGGDEHYLRTGDLGFIKNGELFIAGRLKDLIIVAGRNVYPQDIEWTVESSHPHIRSNSTVAFYVDAEGEERLVVATEIDKKIAQAFGVPSGDDKAPNDASEIIKFIRRAVFDEHEVSVYDIVLLPPGGVFKTSSGKIQRQACRAAFMAGTLTSANSRRTGERQAALSSE